MSEAIKVVGVTKTFRIFSRPIDRLKQILIRNRKFYQEFTALQPVSFAVNQGEAVGIIGRNGSGKSTLLQMIAGTLAPTGGQVKVQGRVAALLELGSGFNPEFTGRENVYLNAAILGIRKEEVDGRLEQILQFADIGDFIDQPVKTYSSGMYLRLAFAVSINVDPDILIVDEALAVGDGRFQLKCFEKIKALKNIGKTILVVSHDMQTIRQICDKVILIDKGKLVEIGNPNDVVNHYTRILYSHTEINKDGVEVESHNKKEGEFTGANSLDVNSSNEYRYGSFDGRIESFSVVNCKNETVKTITTAESIKVSFRVKALRRIEQPIYAMTIKTVKGLEVYGTNNYFQNMDFKTLDQNETATITFDQHMRLAPGDYFISLGFVELIDGDIIPLDRRYDVIELKILPLPGDRSFGVANLESVIGIEYY
ncbi:ABC transporter ATP-binding protein [Paenibacillus sp. GCM10027626]|uniref:ABC transporter ATP-binding protein n=1 Tax=Paenibacillus sp. GCM10027626 TaxID=3273411 RepID=UPI0036350C25